MDRKIAKKFLKQFKIHSNLFSELPQPQLKDIMNNWTRDWSQKNGFYNQFLICKGDALTFYAYMVSSSKQGRGTFESILANPKLTHHFKSGRTFSTSIDQDLLDMLNKLFPK